jgi:hypothetical protein
MLRPTVKDESPPKAVMTKSSKLRWRILIEKTVKTLATRINSATAAEESPIISDQSIYENYSPLMRALSCLFDLRAIGKLNDRRFKDFGHCESTNNFSFRFDDPIRNQQANQIFFLCAFELLQQVNDLVEFR